MKKFAAALAATAALGVVTAFAANPFSDVTPNDWAYQAVVQLKDAGIVNGFPNGTFQGQKDLTRFEMAQMVAKLMAHEDRANAEQRAVINRLANEFANELKTLGVKVDDLSNKIGNVKVTGDARVRYQGESQGDSTFDYRARLAFGATVNDNTAVNVRLTTNDNEFGTGEDNTNPVTFDRLNVVHQFGAVTGVVGRQDLTVGSGLFFDGTFDGVAAVANVGGVTLTTGHGYLVSGNNSSLVGRLTNKAKQGTAIISGASVLVPDNQGGLTQGHDNVTALTEDGLLTKNTPVTLVQASGKIGQANLGAFYAKVNATKGASPVYGNITDVYGVNTGFNVGSVAVNGEWIRNNVKKSDAWTAGLGFGNYDQAKAGTLGVGINYIHAGENAASIDGGGDFAGFTNYKGWHATADYALANNVGLNAWYNFSGKSVTSPKEKVNDNWEVALNYQF